MLRSGPHARSFYSELLGQAILNKKIHFTDLKITIFKTLSTRFPRIDHEGSTQGNMLN